MRRTNLRLSADLLGREAVVSARHLDEGVGLHLVLLLLVKEIGLLSAPTGGAALVHKPCKASLRS
jgi:hypothetical protein